ncbi:MAG: 30S ribosomal protein S2 [Phycisphaerae bacterium]|nr:30S ribosomal protein S2 [Phycisphaerae bacterium]
MAAELVRQLIDSGIHFGHRTSRWNPKMAPFIFGKRNLIHIIDIRETVKGLVRAKKFIAQVVAKGDDILLVGTKRQARGLVQQCARSCGMPFVSERWLGGTLTNFRTIRARLARLEELEREEADGTLQEYSKKMIAMRTRELRKIKRNLDGIRNMDRLPGAVVVIDVHRERNALREARRLNIPTVCLIDTDSDPDFADLPIPGNDDAIRSIDMILTHLAEAVELGKKSRVAPEPAETKGPSPRRPRREPSRGASAGGERGGRKGAESTESSNMAADAVEQGQTS